MVWTIIIIIWIIVGAIRSIFGVGDTIINYITIIPFFSVYISLMYLSGYITPFFKSIWRNPDRFQLYVQNIGYLYKLYPFFIKRKYLYNLINRNEDTYIGEYLKDSSYELQKIIIDINKRHLTETNFHHIKDDNLKYKYLEKISPW